MATKDDIDKTDSGSRLVCGALFGLVVGGYAAFVCRVQSSGMVIALIVLMVLVCSFLAWKYGDRFWRAIVDSDDD